jgi:small subunit ribosomal protein S5
VGQVHTTDRKKEGRGSKERGVRNDNKGHRPNQFRRGEGRANQQQNRRGRRRSGGRFERTRPEYDQKIINIRRVTRVMAGGRRFSFSVAIVAGNRNGKVGVGVGKASDTSLAIEKAFRNAKKNMVIIKRNENLSIPHEVSARYCTSEVYIKPAKGKGLVAGSSARNVLDLAGITDVSSKILSRSKNKINIARAAILALSEFSK